MRFARAIPGRSVVIDLNVRIIGDEPLKVAVLRNILDSGIDHSVIIAPIHAVLLM